MSFSNLGLPQDLTRAVAAQGYDTPTPIQARAIPAVLSGRDVLAAAQTGTGKTAAFVLPILARLAGAGPQRRPRALVLTPTRELAAQIAASAQNYGQHLSLRHTVVFGGVGIQPQIQKLRAGVDILIATPGRLLDLAGQRVADLSGIEVLVLDEADRMLDMGFIHDIRRVLALLPKQRQNLLFSATFSADIRRLAESLLTNPETIDVAPRNAPAEAVEQRAYTVDKTHKQQLLSHLIRQHNWDQVLVFTRTKHGADRLARQLERDGHRAAAIHGNKSQNARTRALADFKDGRVPVLVATDIAARGIDIFELPQVVNFELPHVPEDYVHRIGRTGRAGRSGAAVSLVSPDERSQLKAIERLLGRSLAAGVLEGFVPQRQPSAPAAAETREPRRPSPRPNRPARGRGRPQHKENRR